MGSGSTAIASVRTGRFYIGYDTDEGYVERAERRIAEALSNHLKSQADSAGGEFRVVLPAVAPADDSQDFQARAVREGRQAKELAHILLEQCGFTNIRAEVKSKGLGIVINFVATDHTGEDWAFDVSGAFTSNRAGLRRTDTLWKALGKAAVLHEAKPSLPLVLLTTDKPAKGTAAHQALAVMMRGHGRPIYDLIELLNPEDQTRLHRFAVDGRPE